jgi:hypothetical protein
MRKTTQPSESLNFNSYFNNERYSDVIIQVGDTKWNCHRIILATQSAYFDALFGNGMRESKALVIPIQNITSANMNMMLEFIYTKNMDLKLMTIPKLIELFESTHIFNVLAFTDNIWYRIENSIGISKKIELALKYDQSTNITFGSINHMIKTIRDKTQDEMKKLVGFINISQLALSLIIWGAFNQQSDIREFVKHASVLYLNIKNNYKVYSVYMYLPILEPLFVKSMKYKFSPTFEEDYDITNNIKLIPYDELMRYCVSDDEQDNFVDESLEYKETGELVVKPLLKASAKPAGSKLIAGTSVAKWTDKKNDELDDESDDELDDENEEDNRKLINSINKSVKNTSNIYGYCTHCRKSITVENGTKQCTKCNNKIKTFGSV